jgi:hypothetical protein
MLLLKDECGLCKRVVSSKYLRRCSRCGKLYCINCSILNKEGEFKCLNCARREVAPPRFGTKLSQLSRYLLRRGKFTDHVVLRFSEIEGITGDNLPINAFRGRRYWNNAKNRAWTTVGWNIENVDLNNRTVKLIRLAKSKPKQRKKTKKQTEFFNRPLRFPKTKKPRAPSKTKVAKVQARLRNIERLNMINEPQRTKLSKKSAYERRLFKPYVKPSKT